MQTQEQPAQPTPHTSRNNCPRVPSPFTPQPPPRPGRRPSPLVIALALRLDLNTRAMTLDARWNTPCASLPPPATKHQNHRLHHAQPAGFSPTGLVEYIYPASRTDHWPDERSFNDMGLAAITNMIFKDCDSYCRPGSPTL